MESEGRIRKSIMLWLKIIVTIPLTIGIKVGRLIKMSYINIIIAN